MVRVKTFGIMQPTLDTATQYIRERERERERERGHIFSHWLLLATCSRCFGWSLAQTIPYQIHLYSLTTSEPQITDACMH